MNIEIARAIPMPEILSKIGLQPAKQRNKDYWYYSPFRSEKTPSFHVNLSKNVWYDFGESKGGDTVAFVCAYLKSTGACHTTADALRWLRNMFEYDISLPSVPVQKKNSNGPAESTLELKNVKPLTHIALIRYLEGRGIPAAIARAFLKEIQVYNKATKKEYFAAAIKNEEGGYDYRNPYFKGCVKKKAITFIRGLVPKPEGVNIFEGVMDFLSVIARQGSERLEDDTIILNSLSCLREASGYIRGYGYATAYTWLDNDEAGQKATKAFSEFLAHEKIEHIAMNTYYAPHKDMNEFHMAMLAKKAARVLNR